MDKFQIKESLNLLNTKFRIKTSFKNLEDNNKKLWGEIDLYQKLLKKNIKNDKRIIFDGPPYANGKLHIGHGLNKVLKDICMRYFFANSNYSEFIYGWDGFGLPIENAVTEFINKKKIKEVHDFYEFCHDYVRKQILIQKNQFDQLNLLCPINDNYYLTISKEYIIKEIQIFFKLYKNNYIKKELKPIKWSWSSGCTLAEAEIEYRDKIIDSLYVLFEIKNYLYEGENVYFVIWTTTPWTLTANYGILINKDIEYSIFKLIIKNKFIIISKNNKSDFQKNINEEITFIKDISTKELINFKYSFSLNEENQRVYSSEDVVDTDGTGIVHCSPFHGEVDFKAGIVNNIKSKPAVNLKGLILHTKFENIFYKKADKLIIEYLQNSSELISIFTKTIQYPFDWRKNTEIIYYATEQLFLDIEPIKYNQKKIFDKIEFFPKWGKDKLLEMIQNRNNWCISRQRKWGVPIVFLYSNKKIILNEKLINHYSMLIENNGLKGWVNLNLNEEIFGNFNISDENTKKDKNILDVWFDSGIASTIVLDKYKESVKSSDLIFIEGKDQYRGWFNSTFILNALNNKINNCEKIPCRTLISHGFVLDGKGLKMSKSKKNIISIEDIVNQYGSDIFRLWVSKSNYFGDILVSDEIFNNIHKLYLKFRNCLRYLLGNLSDIKISNDTFMKLNNNKFNFFELEITEFDKYIIYHLNVLINNVKDAFLCFNFNKIIVYLENYLISLLSNKYFDYLKNIIYVTKKNDPYRKNVLLIFINICLSVIKLMMPILPNLAEEVYQCLIAQLNINSEKSIFLLNIPIANKYLLQNYKNKQYVDIILKIISPKLENIFSILSGKDKQSNEFINSKLQMICHIIIFNDKLFDKPTFEFIKRHINSITGYNKVLLYTDNFISKKEKNNIIYDLETSDTDFEIIIEKHPGSKCTRCWNYFYNKEIKKYLENIFCNRCYLILCN